MFTIYSIYIAKRTNDISIKNALFPKRIKYYSLIKGMVLRFGEFREPMLNYYDNLPIDYTHDYLESLVFGGLLDERGKLDRQIIFHSEHLLNEIRFLFTEEVGYQSALFVESYIQLIKLQLSPEDFSNDVRDIMLSDDDSIWFQSSESDEINISDMIKYVIDKMTNISDSMESNDFLKIMESEIKI